jgi:hypothetical protein
MCLPNFNSIVLAEESINASLEYSNINALFVNEQPLFEERSFALISCTQLLNNTLIVKF